MFKFSQLVSKARNPLNLKEILRAQYCCQKLAAEQCVSPKNRKSIKRKSGTKKKDTSFIVMDAMLTQIDSPISSMQQLTMDSSSSSSSARASPLAAAVATSSQSASRNSQLNNQGSHGGRQFVNVARRNPQNDSNLGVSFTFMSYNILAQDLLELHSHLYHNHNRDHLNWEFRLKRLAAEILELRPEILVLQEVQQNHIPMILEALKVLEFDHIFKKKTGQKTDGCAILYNRKLFDLVERHSVEYFQPNVPYLDRENVALIAKLCLKSDPKSCFIASTTHLLYNPRRQDVRLAQLQLLLAELDRISFIEFYRNGTANRLPIILAGDFNLQPQSAPYRLITSGNLAYHNLTRKLLEYPADNRMELIGDVFLPNNLGITDFCQHYDVVKNCYKGETRIQNTENTLDSNENHEKTIDNQHQPLFSSGVLRHDLKLTSVYDHRYREGTTYQDKWITVDYIFYSKQFNPKSNSVGDGHLKLLSRYSVPSLQQCKAIGFIPNSVFGSDHLSLAATFFLERPRK